MLEWYQHIPEHINPIVFSVGFFSLRWYAVMYMTAMVVGMAMLWRRLRESISFEVYLDLVSMLLLGILIGSRIGYVLLYQPLFYLAHPLAIVWPFDMDTGEWIGIAGMSYFGGLIGVVISVWLFSKKQNISFWKLADALVFSTPIAYFFGRIGNFLNGELYGRVTEGAWGMYFLDASGEVLLRHPSQLYEAFFEGVAVFVILFLVWKFLGEQYARKGIFGLIALAYVIAYCTFRFVIEFVREPDAQMSLLFGWMTYGQLYSISVCIIGILLLTRKLQEVKSA